MRQTSVSLFAVFCALLAQMVCMLLYSAAAGYILGKPDENGDYEYWRLTLAQSLASVVIFMLPALGVWRWQLGSVAAGVKPEFRMVKRMPLICGGLACAAMLVCQPLVSWGSFVNESFCRHFSSWEGICKMAAHTNHLTACLIRFDDAPHFVATVVAVSLLPAVCEEFFFRGTVQRFLYAQTGRAVTSIIAASIVFSAMHTQAEAMLPRIILGCLLGVFYHYGGNIWMAVAAHATNNLLVLLYMGFSGGDVEAALCEPTANPGPVMPLLGLAGLWFTVKCFLSFSERTRAPRNNGNAPT